MGIVTDAFLLTSSSFDPDEDADHRRALGRVEEWLPEHAADQQLSA